MATTLFASFWTRRISGFSPGASFGKNGIIRLETTSTKRFPSRFGQSLVVTNRLQQHKQDTQQKPRSACFLGDSWSSTTRRWMATVEAAPTENESTTEAKEEDDDVVATLPTNDNDEELLKIRHSSAHVMAMAVQQVYPEAQVTIGPWIDNGFYYDFYFPETKDPETGEMVEGRKLTDQDLKTIKKAMDKIISKNYPITREEVSREEAERRIKEIQEPFKLEILDSIATDPITIYHIGDEWWDLCAGPHVDSTAQLPKKAI